MTHLQREPRAHERPGRRAAMCHPLAKLAARQSARPPTKARRLASPVAGITGVPAPWGCDPAPPAGAGWRLPKSIPIGAVFRHAAAGGWPSQCARKQLRCATGHARGATTCWSWWQG